MLKQSVTTLFDMQGNIYIRKASLLSEIARYAVDSPPSVSKNRKKERKKSLTRGHVEDIGSTVCIQSYISKVQRGGVPG